MVEYESEKLSELLKAMSDVTRRSLITMLCQQGPTRITDIADGYSMSLNAISKHIKVLEKNGLVKRTTLGRTHLIEAELKNIKVVEDWFKELKSIWELSLERFDELLKDGDEQND